MLSILWFLLHVKFCVPDTVPPQNSTQLLLLCENRDEVRLIRYIELRIYACLRSGNERKLNTSFGGKSVFRVHRDEAPLSQLSNIPPPSEREMDPISVITTVYAIAMGLTQWIDDRKDKGETLKRLSGTVARVCDALRLLQSVPIKNSVDQSVTDSVKSLGDTLRRTQERLLLYGNKRSRNIIAFISPSTITSQLKEDERQLNNQLIIIIFCMTAMGYLKSLNDNAVMPVPVTAEPPVLASISNADVKEFWRDYVGGKVGGQHS
jgi:hypothetical protein